MEKSIVGVEESRNRNESLASASIYSGSLIQINSIAIDISCAMVMEEIETTKHEHFSIRGFVADMRKQDRKKCLPFSSEGGDDDDVMDFPPLSVPKFRWWQCSECVPDIADQRSTLGLVLADNGGENDRLITQNLGDEHGIRDSREGDYNYPNDNLLDFNSRCTHMIEANPVDIQESHNNAADASNIINAPENHSTETTEPDKVSSGSDDNIAYRTLPPKRKPKLRSLADIINQKGNLTNECPRPKSSQIEADLSPHQLPLDVSFETAKNSKTPQRKRKNIVLEDDRGSPETNPSIIPTKRLKGSVIDAENHNNTYKRVGISGLDLERDSPTRLGLLGAKTRPNKPRKQKALDIMKTTPSANLPRYPVAAEASFCDIGPFFKNTLSGQETGSCSGVSKGKRPQEGDYSPFIPNIDKRVALDLSLNSYVNSENRESFGKYTGIPDLNESFVEKTSMTEGQRVPSPHDMSFTLHENVDMPASSSVFSRNMDNNNNTVLERGASEDIPMEIVELLAKNQRERALGNSRKHIRPKGIDNSFKESYPYYVESTPSRIDFPYTDRVGQGFLNFPQPKNCRVDIGNSNKSQFRQFSPPTSSQPRIPLYPCPSMSGPRASEGADLLWPPRRKSVTFDLGGTTQDCSIRHNNGLEDQSYRGKNVYYKKGDGKRVVNDESFVEEGGLGPGRKFVGPIDAYSNDTIPAMQLLSLMDQGIVSGSSFKVGPGNVFDRQFSHCNHHPRPSKKDNENRMLVSSSSFFAPSSGHTNKDFPSLLNGVRYTGDSSNKSFSQGQLPPRKGHSIDLSSPSNRATQLVSRSDLKLEVCTLNRNPADFSIPDANNEFMICAKDLKRKRRNSSKERARPVNVEGSKTQKVRKDPARKESSRK